MRHSPLLFITPLLSGFPSGAPLGARRMTVVRGARSSTIPRGTAFSISLVPARIGFAVPFGISAFSNGALDDAAKRLPPVI
jgi:hypothetical protein